jgi:hypothetical protein
MPKTEQEYRQDIIDIGKLVFQKGWVARRKRTVITQ